MRTSTTPQNLPSLEESHRVVSFVLGDELTNLAGKVITGEPTEDALRGMLGLTIAVVTVSEELYGSVGREAPAQWESLERSAEAFVDHHVIEWLGQKDPGLRDSVTKHRRRKLTARAGKLKLVESARSKQARWASVTLPKDAPLPIAMTVANGLAEVARDAEDRLYTHLAAVPTNEVLVLAGQIVGLLSTAECLLALFENNRVAAFCVHLAALTAADRTDQ